MMMEQVLSALADGARWRILELLAKRPRSVGELAELTGARQPQTTKHLQTLARVGLVSVYPLAQRRVYAIETAPLKSFERQLRELIETADAHAGERDVVARYQVAVEAASADASRERWADGRAFSFERLLSARCDVVWRHWVEADLLSFWWAPPSMVVTKCVLEPKAGGRAVLEYRDAEGRYRSEGRVHAAREPESLVFELSVLDTAEAVLFTGHYDLRLAEVEDGTRLRLGLRITETTIEAMPFIAGIETGWGQVLDNLDAAVSAFQLTNNANSPNDRGERS